MALDRLSVDENPHHLLQLLLTTRLIPRRAAQAAARDGTMHGIDPQIRNLQNYSSECYVLLLLDIGVVYQWDSARLLTDPSQEVTAAMVRGSRSESI